MMVLLKLLTHTIFVPLNPDQCLVIITCFIKIRSTRTSSHIHTHISNNPIHVLLDYYNYRAAVGLNGVDFRGNRLHVETLDKRRIRNRAPFAGMPGGPGRQPDFPLRLLVQSDMVGAIIGRQGSTIRHITQQSRARVDVHRKDNVGSLEKAITIYGNPDNCTNACKRILEVMQSESVSTNKG